MGYPEPEWTRLARIKPGDFLVCYVKGAKKFVGLMEVLGDRYKAADRVWSSGVYPCRLKVRPLGARSVSDGIPIDSIRNELAFYALLNAKNPGGWGTQFQKPPKSISDEDGLVIASALGLGEAAKQSEEQRTAAPSQQTSAETVSEPPSVYPDPPRPATPDDSPPPAAVAREHDHVQFLLLKLGADLGFKVWVARNDRGRSWQGVPFNSLDGLATDLPHQFESRAQSIIELIDVLWLHGNGIYAAFEIEHTTSIYSGILRMSDLVSLIPNLSMKLFLVTPDARRTRVCDELARPTFHGLRLSDICRVITFERLEGEIERAGENVRFMRPEFVDSIASTCS
jgi:hypothetical protein